MGKNSELSTKRKFKLEQTLNDIDDGEFIKLDKSLSLMELEYLVKAIKMPYQDILEDINDYDSNRYNAVIFVNCLASKYSVSNNDVLERVQDVRRISNYKKSIDSEKEISLKKKNKAGF